MSTQEDTTSNTMAPNNRILAYSYSYTSFPSIETPRAQEDDEDQEKEEVTEAEESVVKPRILNLLEPLRQLYTDNILSGFFHELFKKANSLVSGVGLAGRVMSPQSMQRSLGSQGPNLDGAGAEQHPECDHRDISNPPGK